ncbi:unnamed protein product, partial [Prorocentrum cordatum]
AVDPVMAAIRAVEDTVKSVPATCQQKVEASLRPELAAMERRPPAAGFHREVDATVLKIVASSMVKRKDVHDSINAWLD